MLGMSRGISLAWLSTHPVECEYSPVKMVAREGGQRVDHKRVEEHDSFAADPIQMRGL
jgi:hypothetical protein